MPPTSLDTQPSLALAIILATGLSIYALHTSKRQPKLLLPPSPKSYPVIGNLLSVPNEFEHLAFMRISEQLGSKIISLTAFGSTVVVLNDKDDATNLLEKRSSKYSDRNAPPMVSDPSLFEWKAFGSLVGYGDRLRRYRRLMNPWLNKQAVTVFHNSQQDEARLFVRTLLQKHQTLHFSHELETDLYLTTASTLLRSIYGHHVESPDDQFVLRLQKLLVFFTQASIPSNFLVNAIPALKYIPEWFPGAGWKRLARTWWREKQDLVSTLYKQAVNRTLKERQKEIIVSSLRDQAFQLGLSESEVDDHVREVAVTLGDRNCKAMTLPSDMPTLKNFDQLIQTLSTALLFFMAMILFPDVQKKAQQELDAVLGGARLPTLEDRHRFEYLGRVIQETLRWGPAVPLGVPHACFEDDEYKGYHIPKGAVVIGNIWAITRDPATYRDPEKFDPDRYLDPSVPPPPTFGWGRRRCPGIHFAESSLFFLFATILAAFDITATQDEHGNEIKPALKFVNDFMLRPEEFQFRLTPRSTRLEELLSAV